MIYFSRGKKTTLGAGTVTSAGFILPHYLVSSYSLQCVIGCQRSGGQMDSERFANGIPTDSRHRRSWGEEDLIFILTFILKKYEQARH